MAIVKMKKLRLMAVRNQKEELLKQLMIFGCVELREPENDGLAPELSQYLSRESSGVSERRAEKALLQQAIGVLNTYAPAKSPLLSAKPAVRPICACSHVTAFANAACTSGCAALL